MAVNEFKPKSAVFTLTAGGAKTLNMLTRCTFNADATLNGEISNGDLYESVCYADRVGWSGTIESHNSALIDDLSPGDEGDLVLVFGKRAQGKGMVANESLSMTVDKCVIGAISANAQHVGPSGFTANWKSTTADGSTSPITISKVAA